jgi:hypothetical protein
LTTKKTILSHWFLLAFAGITLLMASCNKSTTYPDIPISEYHPLETGKYIVYQLDSLVYLAFGTRDTVISYQVKYETDSLIQDNLGRPAYRIFRYIRKNETQSWRPDASFMAIQTNKQLEFVENNMRFIKLQSPIELNHSWKGNSFIDTYSTNSLVRYLDNWDYQYIAVDQPEMIGSFNLDKCLTVLQRDEVIGIPNQPDSYSEINFSKEIFARGLGMVYKKFYHMEYQPNNGGYVADGSYGITLTMIDHN